MIRLLGFIPVILLSLMQVSQAQEKISHIRHNVLLNKHYSCQNFIKITNLNTQQSFSLKSGDAFKCRYTLFSEYQITVSGRLIEITDSTLVYKYSYFRPSKIIPLNKIQNIDRISLRRYLLPAAVIGSISGSLLVLIGPRASLSSYGSFSVASFLSTLVYVSAVNNTQLNKNKIGESVSLQLYHKDSTGLGYPFYLQNNMPNIYYNR